MKYINVELTDEEHKSYQEYCKKQGRSMRSQAALMIKSLLLQSLLEKQMKDETLPS